MKKYIPLFALGVLLIGFLFIKNENYRNELKHVKNQISEMDNSDELINLDAGEIGEKFITSYFNYQGKPAKEDVEIYLSDEILKTLNFDTSNEYDENLSEINSSVKNLDIYLGKATDGKQKVLGVFSNEIGIGDEINEVDSFVELDLEKVGDSWLIVDFRFFQY